MAIDATEAARSPSARAPLRTVALPHEHGGWGLTLEPVLLGLLVAPSVAGGALGAAAVLAFLVRTPLKVVGVDWWRHRHLPRTRLAARVAALELAAMAALVSVRRAGRRPRLVAAAIGRRAPRRRRGGFRRPQPEPAAGAGAVRRDRDRVGRRRDRAGRRKQLGGLDRAVGRPRRARRGCHPVRAG
jgi:hypothetical protein